MIFEWNPCKAESNLRKHGLSFALAAQVFADPFAFSRQERIEDGEYRWRTIGVIGGSVVVVVAHTVSNSEAETEVIRIISARRATRIERKKYEEANRR